MEKKKFTNILPEPTVKELSHEEFTPLNLIEHIGRTCYKSTSDFTEDTNTKFFKMLVERKHYAMLEHATLLFELDDCVIEELLQRFSLAEISEGMRYLHFTQDGRRNLISGSIRAFNECSLDLIRGLIPVATSDYSYCLDGCETESYFDWASYMTLHATYLAGGISDVQNPTKNEVMNHTYMSLDINCDRGISHELVRHRNCAFAQESTRYCNYTNDRFGDMTFVRMSEKALGKSIKLWEKTKDFFNTSEELYTELVNAGIEPQEARSVLPHALRTEIVITANLEEWKHIIDLRYHETTGKAHPEAKKVAEKAKAFYDAKLRKLLG